MTRHFTVLGAGIVGVCCAAQLRADGHEVTLIDRLLPGTGCSFGNAGMIQVGGVVPQSTPGIIRQVPKMLLDPWGPLVIRWRYLPRLAPFLARFMAAGTPGNVARISASLASILAHAKDAYLPMIHHANAWHLMREMGELYVYRSEAAWQAAQEAHDLRRAQGIPMREIPMGELYEREPALARIFTRSLLLTETISTISPGSLTQALADQFVRDGGTILRAEVLDLEIDTDGKRRLLTAAGPRELDELVIAAGAYSKKWAKKLGSRIPLDTERGHHMMIEDPGIETNGSIIFGDQKFGASSMLGGLRIVGTSELAKLDAPANFDRAYRLLDMAKMSFPDLRIGNITPWMGHRPTTPDSLPVIGKAPNAPKTYFAFGHGHSGLTMAAITGKTIADLANGRTPAFDIAPFRADRF